MPSVSRTEKVTDSPCLGKGLKVNSQVYDLMSSKSSDSRSIPLSVREATVLETTLWSMMESYNFQLWTITALFRFLGESGHFNLDDPLLDQFQRSFSRGTENVAAAMASAVAFVTTKRRESFLSHMVPSCHGGPEAQTVVGSSLPTEGSLCECHPRGGSSCGKRCLLV